MVGPTFDPLAAATMSTEESKAARSDASQAAEHRLEDLKAATARAEASRPRSLRARLRSMLSSVLPRSR
jgi:hypothetical protein